MERPGAVIYPPNEAGAGYDTTGYPHTGPDAPVYHSYYDRVPEVPEGTESPDRDAALVDPDNTEGIVTGYD